MFRGNSSLKPTLRIGSRFVDRRSVFIVVMSLFLVLFLGIAVRNTYADSENVSRTGKHVLTVYDNGSEKGVLTEAHTLREALEKAGITVGEYDVTEPSLDDELVAATYDVNIYRARPVSVHDGTTVKKVMSPYRAATQIAKQAGVSLRDEDAVDLELSDDVVNDGAVERLVVDRATAFTFIFYGEKQTAYTQGETVGDMLAAKGITLTASDRLSLDVSTPITAGMTVSLWREGKQTVTRTEVINYSVREIQDADQLYGYRKVKTAGVNGEQLVTYEIVLDANGQEVSKEAVKTVVTKEATEQVEIVGTKYNLPAGSHEDWMAAAGIAASDYGFVNYIVGREGGWEPCKVFGGAIDCAAPATGPYGMLQANPGTKMASAGDDWRTNPITQLRWGTGYAVGRYGSWENAYIYWTQNNHW